MRCSYLTRRGRKQFDSKLIPHVFWVSSPQSSLTSLESLENYFQVEWWCSWKDKTSPLSGSLPTPSALCTPHFSFPSLYFLEQRNQRGRGAGTGNAPFCFYKDINQPSVSQISFSEGSIKCFPHHQKRKTKLKKVPKIYNKSLCIFSYPCFVPGQVSSDNLQSHWLAHIWC